MTVESFDKYLGDDSQIKLNQVLNRDTFTWSWNSIYDTNEDGTLKPQFDERGNILESFDFNINRDDKTYLGTHNLPMFDDKDMMEYLYAPYMEDAQTIPLEIGIDVIIT